MTVTSHPGTIDVGGTHYLRDAKGSLVPIATIKAADLLMDEQVRSLLVKARERSAEIAAFKASTFEAVGTLQALLAGQYGAMIGGKKGNVTLLSFDGCQKVQVQVSDQLDFGPELQAAKTLVDECLTFWSSDAPVELKAVVTRAFLRRQGRPDQPRRAIHAAARRDRGRALATGNGRDPRFDPGRRLAHLRPLLRARRT